MDFRRGEILYDPSFVYPDANEICDKLLLVINKSHSDPDDVVIVPCKTNIRNFQFPPGCNEHDRMFFFEKQIGFYKANTILQLWAIDSKPCDYFDDMIAKKRIDRLNKFTTQEELGRIINCLKRLKKDIPVYIQELIF